METKEKQCYKCEKCGYDRFKVDTYAQLKGVVRWLDGNAVCAECNEPAPIDI